jgi:hypothetical protein
MDSHLSPKPLPDSCSGQVAPGAEKPLTSEVSRSRISEPEVALAKVLIFHLKKLRLN